MPPIDAVSSASPLLPLALIVPVVGVLACVAAGRRRAHWIALLTVTVGLALAVAIVVDITRSGEALQYALGGWSPPLGVRLRADGLAAAMMLTTVVLIGATVLFSWSEFRTPPGASETRASFAFWPLLLAVWGALNVCFLACDFFTLYVALELLTFAAVPLVSLDGRGETLAAALRYLLFALIGSVLYLVGTVVLYGGYGTLDLLLLSQRVHAEPALCVAAALMTAGLLAKTALFPLHLWLPPAHAGAPAAASAVLSALVIKGSFFIVVRLWFDVMPALASRGAAQALAALGAAAILFGSVLALKQARLKMLIAYSTVAQIGYLFLMFPLAFAAGSSHLASGTALTGGMLQTISHATAKAAMFMASGVIYTAVGHDRIANLGGIGRALPLSVFAFALGGISLIGLPPSGGFLAKWVLLTAAATGGQWWWAVVMLIGGLLTACYVFVVLAKALRSTETVMLRAPVQRHQEAVALALAIVAVLLGFVAFADVKLLDIGRPEMALTR